MKVADDAYHVAATMTNHGTKDSEVVIKSMGPFINFAADMGVSPETYIPLIIEGIRKNASMHFSGYIDLFQDKGRDIWTEINDSIASMTAYKWIGWNA